MAHPLDPSRYSSAVRGPHCTAGYEVPAAFACAWPIPHLSGAAMDAMTSPQPADANNIVPFRSGHRWEDVKVRIGPLRPRIEPGTYEAISVGLRRYRRFDRAIVEVTFNIFEGQAGVSRLIASDVPMFNPLPDSNGALSPNCRLAQMLGMLDRVRRDKHRTCDLSVLEGKVWRLTVDDTKQDHTGKLKDTELVPYSVVRRVLSRA
jgi:hypothetical protein